MINTFANFDFDAKNGKSVSIYCMQEFYNRDIW